MNPIMALDFSIELLLLGAIVTAFLGRYRRLIGQIAFVFITLAAICLFYVAFKVFASGPIVLDRPLWEVAGIGAGLLIRIDGLSALFLALIALVSILTSLYATRYMNIPIFQELSLRSFYPLLQIFFAAVVIVVVVADIFFFFIFWEVMTLTSYFLVIFNKSLKPRLRAGFKYFFITHVATALMFIAAIILYNQSGSFSFEGLSQAMRTLANNNPGLLHLVLALFLIGFATKAGILPMGDWLPDAYPAAPTPASAAFAGVMSKLGIYGLLRIFIDILPSSEICILWGTIIAILGTISIFVGSMTALTQDDSKKLLAFSIIGQMGYILFGIGVSLHFMPKEPTLASVVLIATLFHLVNNVFFKVGLFFTAGSIYYRTGSSDLNEVGGLSRLLPLTAATAIIAAFSMSGVPLLGGFSSKWMLFISTITGGTKVPVFMALAMVALFVSVVTLAYSVKFVGASFFGKFRAGAKPVEGKEVPFSMQFPQVVMALLCIVPGILPMLAIRPLAGVTGGLLGQDYGLTAGLHSNSLVAPIALDFGTGLIAVMNPLIIVIVFVIAMLVSLFFYRAGGAPRRADATWYCGELHSDDEVFYPAKNYYKSFKELFGIRIGSYAREGVYPTIRYPKVKLTERNLFKRIIDVDKWFYQPLVNGFMALMRRFSVTHSGVPHVYLLWLVIGALAAIAVLFLLTGGHGQV